MFGRGPRRRGLDGETVLVTVNAKVGEPVPPPPPYVAARSIGNAHGLADRITARQAVKLGRGANLADLDLGQLAKCNHVFGYESYQPPT